MINIEIRRSEKLSSSEYSGFVTFDYNSEIVNAIKSLPYRMYNPDNKTWEIPADKINELKSKLPQWYHLFNIVGEVPNAGNNEPLIPESFEYKTEPYEHQKVSLEYGMKYNRWFLGDEQGLGKALALDTKIYTYPDGYKLMRDIEVGDYVFGKNGMPTKVIATYYHKNVEMYRFTFSDGVSIDCCKDHLWQIHTQHGYKVVDTNWFLQKNQFGVVRKDNLFSGGSYNYYIDRCEPVQFRFMPVNLHPYIVGSLLGDGGLTSGSVTFTTKDEETVRRINDLLPQGYELHSSKSMEDISYNIVNLSNKASDTNIVKAELKDLKLMGTNSHTKFIPHIYKYNSPEIRISILQGLLDTDGYATKNNLVQYTTVSKQLAEDVRFIVESLGGIVSWSEGLCGYNGKITSTAYTLTIKFDDPTQLFRLTRKRALLKPRRFKPRRQIISIEKIENADAKCITVDSKDHLYLAEHFVVTHNTKQAIDIAIARKLKYGYKHCLIVCGVNTLKWNWVNEILTHSNELAFILGQKARRDGKIVVGSTKDKLADLQLIEKDTNNIQPYFIITNVESFRDEKIANTIKTLCDKKIINMCVADEMHKMKNPTSQQTKGFLKCLPECRIGMTGTPLMNNPLDLYVILKWLGYETHAFYSFKQHYCVMGGYGGYEIIGYRNMQELTAKVKDIMLRRLKTDVLDLPEKIYVDEYVDMTPKQSVIYKEVECSVKANIDLIKSNNNPLSQLIRLRQATGYTGILSSEVKESAKLDRMEDIVEEVVANDNKCLIFSNWTQMTDIICERLLKTYPGAVTCITGGTNDFNRQSAVDRFQRDDTCKIIVGTIGAMGTGLTLTAGTTIIFVDEPWNKALFDQAVDRAHRIGTTSNITIYSLMCKDTIDERIHQIIYKKGEMSDAIIDGKILGDKGMVIDYLLN